MTEADDEAVKQTIMLSRRLCAVDWLTEQHATARDALRTLTSSEEVKAKLCIGQLSLWTICSRETSSSAIRRAGSAHIVVDGFQLLALSKVFSAVILSAGSEAATSAFLGLLAEAFLCAGRTGMASLCKSVAVDAYVGRNAGQDDRVDASVLELLLQIGAGEGAPMTLGNEDVAGLKASGSSDLRRNGGQRLVAHIVRLIDGKLQEIV